ncbi:alpha/beta fold hydrolase [Oryzihumus leptocrescens]|uniref:Pimeloyl-ACP methyl ester carboxylesterase n=1 Tax=Oryzihumus leptocrescens TaxID=297536 RepID=A0A542ZJB9_9MICO|nr:alpha/beta hydrolase [Oryzihumus leptocrescens]TQL60452.1 pimeloyl-ACP methyl ester carboxylesterase [Oryzihumus leptocrescens]
MDRTSVVEVGGIAQFIREIGPDEGASPPLVVIHGGPDWDHTYLLPGLMPVSLHRHVILFDMRGCGRSTRGLGPDGYQPEFVVEDLSQLIQALGHHTVDLLGFSTGGQVAQLFVESHRRLVRRLILASTTAYAGGDHYLVGWQEYERRLQIRAPRPAWAECRHGEGDRGVRGTVQWALDAAPIAIWDLDRLDEYLALLEGVTFSGEWLGPFREGRLHAWRPTNPEQALRDFVGPILILHGAQDMGFPVQVAQRLHAAVPATSLRVLDQAGHMAHFDQPQAWSSAVLDFLGG